LGSLFELSDVHVIGHVTVRGPPYRYLLGPSSPLDSSSQSLFIYISHASLVTALTILIKQSAAIINASESWVCLGTARKAEGQSSCSPQRPHLSSNAALIFFHFLIGGKPS
jgi:hypothetical protein